MEEDYDIAETNDDTNVTISDNFENANVTETEFHEYHDYSYDDMPTKIHHLMYSDTLIVVISLIIMIIVGLVFRTLCIKLTSCNQRKERMRGGLRALADHMNHVTRSMSDDLELPDSPKTVIRTYSNAARTTPGGGGGPPTRGEQQNSLFLMAINNNMAEAGNNNNSKEEIEMGSRSSSTVKIEIHNDERNSR